MKYERDSSSITVEQSGQVVRKSLLAVGQLLPCRNMPRATTESDTQASEQANAHAQAL